MLAPLPFAVRRHRGIPGSVSKQPLKQFWQTKIKRRSDHRRLTGVVVACDARNLCPLLAP